MFNDVAKRFVIASVFMTWTTAQRIKSADYLNILNDQVFPSMELLFPDDTGIFRDDKARIYRPHILKDRFRNLRYHFHTYIG